MCRTLAVKTDNGVAHTIKRAHKQSAIVPAADGRDVSNIDLDRGTYLPLDAYNHDEIGSIADELLGEKSTSKRPPRRRALGYSTHVWGRRLAESKREYPSKE